MLVEVDHQDEVAVVTVLASRFDAAVAPIVRSEVVARTEEGLRRIVIDLRHVQFVDSSGLGALVSIFKALGGSGEVVLCGVAGSVRSMLQLTRMDRIFPIEADVHAACAKLSS